jgi:hypothetical protein
VRSKHTYRLFFVLTALLLVNSARVAAQKLNYELVSLYVYNFTKYIEWPADKTNSDFVVGVYGSSPVTAMLNKYVSAKHVGTRIITIKQISTPAELSSCSIVFIPADESSKIKQFSDQLKGKPILIVTEKYGQSKKGAGISIYLDEDDEDKTKFEISKATILANGLIISQNLLKLATKVY